MQLSHIPLLLKRKYNHILGYKIGYSKKNKQTYFSIPELGIEGRRPGTDIKTRMTGIREIMSDLSIDRDTTVLDVGCAEGLVAREFYGAGARTIHGFDLQDISVEIAIKLFGQMEGMFYFGQANILDWSHFIKKYKNVIKKKYDIVLLLSVYNHIVRVDEEKANDVLKKLANRTNKYFIVRSPTKIPHELIEAQGFKISFNGDKQTENNLTIFERISS